MLSLDVVTYNQPKFQSECMLMLQFSDLSSECNAQLFNLMGLGTIQGETFSSSQILLTIRSRVHLMLRYNSLGQIPSCRLQFSILKVEQGQSSVFKHLCRQGHLNSVSMLSSLHGENFQQSQWLVGGKWRFSVFAVFFHFQWLWCHSIKGLIKSETTEKKHESQRKASSLLYMFANHSTKNKPRLLFCSSDWVI